MHVYFDNLMCVHRVVPVYIQFHHMRIQYALGHVEVIW